MLLERNDNRRQQELPSTKHTLLPKNTKKFQKENKQPLNNPFTSHSTPKPVAQPQIDDPRKNLLVTETNKIKATNLKKILAFELAKSRDNFRTDFLQRHKVTADIRTRMVS